MDIKFNLLSTFFWRQLFAQCSSYFINFDTNEFEREIYRLCSFSLHLLVNLAKGFMHIMSHFLVCVSRWIEWGHPTLDVPTYNLYSDVQLWYTVEYRAMSISALETYKIVAFTVHVFTYIGTPHTCLHEQSTATWSRRCLRAMANR